jgi:hypothetical protein
MMLQSCGRSFVVHSSKFIFDSAATDAADNPFSSFACSLPIAPAAHMSFLFPIHSHAHLIAEGIQSVSLLGTVNHRRWRWNPFDPLNDMILHSESGHWKKELFLSSRGGRHANGIYSFRLVLNHNPRRYVKAAEVIHEGWRCAVDQNGVFNSNMTFSIASSGNVTFIFDPLLMTVQLEAAACSPTALSEVMSLELNGFPWDQSDIFDKFNETSGGRKFRRLGPDKWEIEVQLSNTGGIDFRKDGVYQFLISCNADEDQGFGAFNSLLECSTRLSLVKGTGFGSSYGTSMHSAPTLKVTHDGVYKILVERGESGWSAQVLSDGHGSAYFLNRRDSIQLLGTVFSDRQFDPTVLDHTMVPTDREGIVEARISVKKGCHAINFAIGAELFLDTMGLGCWLDKSSEWAASIQGIGWHGKPNEVNICFEVSRDSVLTFRYDTTSDHFSIIGDGDECLLRPFAGILELSLVGSFSAPLQAWDSSDPVNLMTRLSVERFEKYLFLDAGVRYEYKYVANRSPWLVVFADYEFDGYGMSYSPDPNFNVFDSRLENLKRHGHLTSHGNPPSISFTPDQSGFHRFIVDLSTGAYGVFFVDSTPYQEFAD